MGTLVSAPGSFPNFSPCPGPERISTFRTRSCYRSRCQVRPPSTVRHRPPESLAESAWDAGYARHRAPARAPSRRAGKQGVEMGQRARDVRHAERRPGSPCHRRLPG